jgi:hypothetical protein
MLRGNAIAGAGVCIVTGEPREARAVGGLFLAVHPCTHSGPASGRPGPRVPGRSQAVRVPGCWCWVGLAPGGQSDEGGETACRT